MTEPELETEIRASLTRITLKDATQVPLDADLSETLGLDSLGQLELLAEVEDLLETFFEEIESGSRVRTIREMLALTRRYLNQPDLEAVR